ncbi:hypothetical protein U729_3109 (plasmid) [Clostridium baratii str. Sullivan]|uniref:Uncharacterized protein n=1 Tax=Clostridium baratii str. Sullivan TaxID=1415775 RepID=A0A0A7G025_9CLOT|nr:hypothetical protein [Clostridium baratii]AIY85208.1 hypothetical protein U729_3109 [Clostridium baratii str. Sullivan]
MKRMFLVEINYEELDENIDNKTEVLQETAIEIALEDLISGYVDTNSIKGNYYSIDVRELN